MTDRVKLATALVKFAMDEEAIHADMLKRLEKFKKENLPKGLPDTSQNKDETDPDYPTQHNTPPDKGWEQARIISGSGGGPAL